jgi:hypothetical protein
LRPSFHQLISGTGACLGFRFLSKFFHDGREARRLKVTHPQQTSPFLANAR